MHIQKTFNNIAFGYNKKLNNIVNNKLKNDNESPEIDNHLLRMNKLCMNTEDKLRNAEKLNNKELMDYYTNMLVTIKPIVIDEIEEKYPELNFRKIECKTYRKEAEETNKETFNWRYLLANSIEYQDELNEMMYKAQADGIDNYSDANTMGLSKEAQIPTSEEDNEDKEDEDDLDITQKNNPNIQNNDKTLKNNSDTKIEELLEKFIPTERSPKGFEDLGGLESLKEKFEEAIIEPIKYPDMAEADKEDYGLTLPRGFLLYGPPGCGKTSIVEALSQEADLPLYKLRISRSGSEFINKSSKNIETVFDYLSKQYKETGTPSILFMDEAEALAPSRKSRNIGKEDIKMVSTLLPLIEEGRSKGIILIVATNCPDLLEDAVKFRLDAHEYIGLPDKENRLKILKVHLNSRKKGMALGDNDEKLESVANKTEGFSSRTLAILVDDAAKIARKDNRRNICAKDFDDPIAKHIDEKIDEKKYKIKDSSKHNPIGFIGI